MADDQWRAIEIDSDGYRIVDDPPVHFRREAGMLPLPVPTNIGPGEAYRSCASFCACATRVTRHPCGEPGLSAVAAPTWLRSLFRVHPA